MPTLRGDDVQITISVKGDTGDIDKASKKFKKFSQDTIKSSRAIVAGVAAAGGAIVAGLGFAAKAAIDFEDGLANVRKSTGATDQELKNIGDSLLDLSTKSRTSLSALTEIATIGGQMGVATKDIESFTEAIDIAVVALSDEFTGGAEEVTSQMGKLRNLFTDIRSDRIDQDILHISNAINELGASGLATGGFVSEAARRIAGIAVPLGATTGQVLGLSATMEELGFNVERGSSSVVRTLQLMAKDTAGFAKIAGTSLGEFSDLVDTDINAAFVSVLDGINELNPSATEMAAILDDLGLSGVGNAELFLKMAENSDLLAEKQNLATEALKGTDSVLAEFNIKNETTAAQLAIVRDNFTKIAIEVGSVVLPVIVEFTNWLKDEFIPQLKILWQWLSDNKEIVLGVAAALVIGMIPAFFAAISAIILTIIAMAPLLIAMTLIGTAIAILAKAWKNNWLDIRGFAEEQINRIIGMINGLIRKLDGLLNLINRVSEFLTGNKLFEGGALDLIQDRLGVDLGDRVTSEGTFAPVSFDRGTGGDTGQNFTPANFPNSSNMNQINIENFNNNNQTDINALMSQMNFSMGP